MFLKNLCFGIIIGIGFIIPGVSGGVLATILGIYDTIITKIIEFKKDIKNNLLYLMPLFIGIIIGILLFSKVILYLLDTNLNFISYVFIGLILGCIPYLIQEIKFKSNNKSLAFFPFLIALLLGILLFIIENNFPETLNNPNPLIMIIAGILYAMGKLIPGISGAALLMLLGIYKYFLSIIANPLTITLNIFIKFLPFIISFIISSIFILKFMHYLLNNHFRLTYSAIIGFVISSILFIYPNNFNFLSIIIASLSFTISYIISK